MHNMFSILFICIFLIGCLGNRSTFDQIEKIEKFGTPNKIEYYEHLQGKPIHYSDTPSFIIADSQGLNIAIQEIKEADNPEPWKGAGWGRIKVFYLDTILNINTNKKKIGLSASGTFYDLPKDNFITKRVN